MKMFVFFTSLHACIFVIDHSHLKAIGKERSESHLRFLKVFVHIGFLKQLSSSSKVDIG